jgi:sigma-B regulation protein RsbU (phosphoserine phosphatase)
VVAKYLPVDHVAGDLYDIFALPNGSAAFVLLDVVGHGVSAALLTGVMKMSLRYRLAESPDPTEALARANEDLIACSDDGDFVTACVAVWDATSRTWTYSSAGHFGGVLLRRGHAEVLPAQGPLLGVIPDGRWTGKAVELGAGDRLFLFTDGVVEAGAPSEMLGMEGLMDLLCASSGLGLAAQTDRVVGEATARNGGERTDDITIIGIEAVSQGM